MGEVALIGAGTGPADLLTVRARERLRTAGVLIYDSRRVEDCLQYVPADCEIHYLGRGDDFLNRVTNAPAEMLVHAARRGRAVVRLYEGDPLLLQPGFSEAAELEKYGIRYELIPGVSDLTAVPAYLGCALQEPDSVNGTHLFSGSSRTLKNLYYSALSNPGETLMFQNAVTDLPDLVAGLLRGGLSPDTPAAVVTAATLPQQRAVYGRLGNIAERTVQNNLPAASSLLIGAQLKPNRRLSWWPPKGVLSGKTVAVVYARPQTQKRNLLAEGIRTMGGRPLRIDLLKVERRSGFEEELEKVLGLPRPGKLWILMTSVNAVRAFGDALCRLQTDRRSLHNVRFAAAHKKIADALRTVGFAADLIPAQNSPRALTDELLQAVHKTDRILQIRGSRRYGSVAFNLQTAGLSYMDIQAYATTVDGSAFEGLLQKADYLVFTSISGVLFFVKALRDAGLTPAAVREASVQLFARGGVTARSIKKYDLPLAVEAGAAGDMELLENLVDYARREPNHDSRSN
jgi:uroporphyrinogen III methyltransferase/synthase